MFSRRGFGLAVLLAGVVFVGSFMGFKALYDMPRNEPVKVEGFRYVKNGFFDVRNGRVVKHDSRLGQAEVLDWFVDPFCSACVKLDGIMANSLPELSRDMTVRYHVLGLLSPKSMDDYSVRASAFILGVAEKAPDRGVAFYKAVMSDRFKPDEGSGRLTSDKRFEDLFYSVGGSKAEWVEVVKVHGALKGQVREWTSRVFNDAGLAGKAPDRLVTIPFITIGDSPGALDFTEAVDAEDYFMGQYRKYVGEVLRKSGK